MTPGRSRDAAYELACFELDLMSPSERYTVTHGWFCPQDENAWLEKRTEELMEDDGEREDGEDR